MRDGQGFPVEMADPSTPHKSIPINRVFAKMMGRTCRKGRVTLTSGDKTVTVVRLIQ
jgi:hypothetical protein